MKKVFAQETGQSKIEIIPFEENNFSLVGEDTKLTFKTDEGRKINGLTLHQGGGNEAKKWNKIKKHVVAIRGLNVKK